MTNTAIVVLAACIIVGLWDAVVVARTGIGTSVSRFLQKLGFKSPVFVLMIGIVLGHVFFEMEPEAPDCAVVVPTEMLQP